MTEKDECEKAKRILQALIGEVVIHPDEVVIRDEVAPAEVPLVHTFDREWWA